MFEKEEFLRYLRQMILDGFHREGQIQLKQAKVLVIGAGGLGCSVLQYLTAVGIGTIGIVDFDSVEVSNLHRQVLYGDEDLGLFKVAVAKEKLKKQNPYVEIETYCEKINEQNATSIISQYDLVIDGCDNFATRYLVNDICVQLRKPLVYGSVLGYQGQIALFNINSSGNLRDIFPEAPNANEVPDCSTNGVLGTVPALIGAYMAQVAIRFILGDDSWKDKYLIVDTLTMETTTLSYRIAL